MVLGRVAGIPIRVHWTFALLVALVVAGSAPSGLATLANAAAWVTALFACVVVHELAHCLVARRRGATVLDILLLPIGGLSELAEMPTAPRDEGAVAAAGPAVSIVLGLVLLSGAAVAGLSAWPPSLLEGSWPARLGWLNLLLGAFNLLPAFPMDGGRVLRAALARRYGRPEATRRAARIARVLAVVMIVAGVAYDLWLALIGVFVMAAASAEEGADRGPGSRGPPAGRREGGIDGPSPDGRLPDVGDRRPVEGGPPGDRGSRTPV